jgi:hypothetical protein
LTPSSTISTGSAEALPAALYSSQDFAYAGENGGGDVPEASAKPDQGKKSDIASTRQLITKAEQGDAKALVEVRKLFAQVPEMWTVYGDLAANALRSWVQAYSVKNELAKEAIGRQLDKMRAELAGPSPTPLEGLLVDRILTCWIALQYCEAIYVQNMKELSINQADYHQRRLDRAQRRYLDAIRTLAHIRRLGAAVIQVNIAEKQVNVAAGGE